LDKKASGKEVSQTQVGLYSTLEVPSSKVLMLMQEEVVNSIFGKSLEPPSIINPPTNSLIMNVKDIDSWPTPLELFSSPKGRY
jgi:hypothetical protein